MDISALKKSAALLHKAKRLEPDRLEIHERLAKVFSLLLPLLSETEVSRFGTRTKCRQEFFWLTDFYRQKKDLTLARRQLEDWIQLQKDDLEAHARLAELHEETGDKAKATAVYSEIAEQHLKQGQNAEAGAVLEKAIQLEPGRTDLRRRLIEIHEEIGSRQQSLEERFSLAETLLEQGNRDEAKAECRRLQSAR